MATLEELESVLRDLDSPYRILVDAKSLSLRPSDLLNQWDDYARPQTQKFYSGPNGSVLMSRLLVITPDGREFGTFEANELSFWKPWFIEYLTKIGATTATITVQGVDVSDGRFFPLSEIRFGKTVFGRRRKSPDTK